MQLVAPDAKQNVNQLIKLIPRIRRDKTRARKKWLMASGLSPTAARAAAASFEEQGKSAGVETETADSPKLAPTDDTSGEADDAKEIAETNEATAEVGDDADLEDELEDTEAQANARADAERRLKTDEDPVMMKDLLHNDSVNEMLRGYSTAGKRQRLAELLFSAKKSNRLLYEMPLQYTSKVVIMEGLEHVSLEDRPIKLLCEALRDGTVLLELLQKVS
eukprot:COSAG05_NODE_6759_length_907_cov_0.814356_1_plen_219_part_10